MAYPSDLSRTKDWGAEVLLDTDLEGQLDLVITWLMAAFNESTGHSHDGTENEAPQIDVTDLDLPSGAAEDILYHDGSNLDRMPEGTYFSVGMIIDGGGDVINTGVAGDILIPVKATILEVWLLADQSGAIKVDLWKDTYTNFPPTDADTITAGAEPEIAASGTKDNDSTLTGWTTAVTAEDIIRVNVDSCTTITRCAVILKLKRTA